MQWNHFQNWQTFIFKHSSNTTLDPLRWVIFLNWKSPVSVDLYLFFSSIAQKYWAKINNMYKTALKSWFNLFKRLDLDWKKKFEMKNLWNYESNLNWIDFHWLVTKIVSFEFQMMNNSCSVHFFVKCMKITCTNIVVAILYYISLR